MDRIGHGDSQEITPWQANMSKDAFIEQVLRLTVALKLTDVEAAADIGAVFVVLCRRSGTDPLELIQLLENSPARPA